MILWIFGLKWPTITEGKHEIIISSGIFHKTCKYNRINVFYGYFRKVRHNFYFNFLSLLTQLFNFRNVFFLSYWLFQFIFYIVMCECMCVIYFLWHSNAAFSLLILILKLIHNNHMGDDWCRISLHGFVCKMFGIQWSSCQYYSISLVPSMLLLVLKTIVFSLHANSF